MTRAALPAVIASALVAVATAAAGEGSSDATLLARHAPVLVLHPTEVFAPVPVEGFIADSDLLARQSDGTWAPAAGPLASAGPDTRLDQRLCQAIDGTPGEPCYADAERARAGKPTAYGAVFRRSGRIVLQYWLWYPFNGYSPTLPPGEFWIAHEGDWESVTVVLDAKERPQLVGLSSHCGGHRRSWSTAPRKGTHPVAYVARGSHANYFTPGTQRVSSLLDELLVQRCFTTELLAVYKAYGVELVDHTGAGRTVRPRVLPVTASRPGWMRFRGTWGEDRYIGFPKVDPFRNGAGPEGPAFHAQWKRPLAVPLAWPVG